MTPKSVFIINPKLGKVDSFRYDEGDVPPIIVPDGEDKDGGVAQNDPVPVKESNVPK